MSCYLALEGPDACGKSTQAQRLVQWLRDRGEDVLHLREPGSTPVGEKLRELLLDRATGDLLPASEALLFTAARSELVAKVIEPALAAGTIVVSERCYLSTWVYQGRADEARKVPMADLEAMTALAHRDTWPDRILILDVAVEEGSQRRAGEVGDRIESKGDGYHERVRQGYLEIGRRDPERYVVLDAGRPADVVHQAICDVVAGILEA